MSEPLTITATVGYETIVLTLHGTPQDGSLVMSDGRGLQLITLNTMRLPALVAAFAKLGEVLDGHSRDGA